MAKRRGGVPEADPATDGLKYVADHNKLMFRESVQSRFIVVFCLSGSELEVISLCKNPGILQGFRRTGSGKQGLIRPRIEHTKGKDCYM